MLTKRRKGLKGEPSPGVPPLRAAPAARSPCDAITQAVNERRAGVEPRPYEGLAERGEVGGGRTFGSSRTPSPTTGGRRPVRHVIYRESIPRLGGNVVRPAWTVRAGRRGRRPLQGGCGSMGPAVYRRRTQSRFQSKNAPGGAFSAYFSVFSAFSSGSGGAQKRPYIVAYLRILAASSGLASPGFMRQRQLPWAVPGTFMRACAPRPR